MIARARLCAHILALPSVKLSLDLLFISTACFILFVKNISNLHRARVRRKIATDHWPNIIEFGLGSAFCAAFSKALLDKCESSGASSDGAVA